jgi:hypothetical protein
MSYRVISWENSTDSKEVFNIQQKILTMTVIKKEAASKLLIKKFKIPDLASNFLLSLPSFTVDNMEKYQPNSDIHST